MALESRQGWIVEGDTRVEVWRLDTFERAEVIQH